MNVNQVHCGRITPVTESAVPEFKGEQATPFPLTAVYQRLYGRSIVSNDLSSNPDVMEMAVHFQNTFGEGISLPQIRDAQSRVDSRIENDNDDTPSQTIVLQETVEAYGRDYAFTTSTFRRQYDAVKWYGTVGLYALGDATIRAIDTATTRLSAWWEARQERNAEAETPTSLRGRIRNAIPGVQR